MTSEKFVDEAAKRLARIREALKVNHRTIGRATEGAPIHDLTWYGMEKRNLANVDLDHVVIMLRRLVNALDTPATDADALIEFVKTGKGFPWADKVPPWREGRSPIRPKGRPRIHPIRVPGQPQIVPARLEVLPDASGLAQADLLKLAGIGGAALIEAQRNKQELPPRVLELIDYILSLLPNSKKTALMFMVAGCLGITGEVRTEILGQFAARTRYRSPSIDGLRGTPPERKRRQRA